MVVRSLVELFDSRAASPCLAHAGAASPAFSGVSPLRQKSCALLAVDLGAKSIMDRCGSHLLRAVGVNAPS